MGPFQCTHFCKLKKLEIFLRDCCCRHKRQVEKVNKMGESKWNKVCFIQALLVKLLPWYKYVALLFLVHFLLLFSRVAVPRLQCVQTQFWVFNVSCFLFEEPFFFPLLLLEKKMLVQLNKESPMLNHGDQIIYLKSFTPRPSLLAKPNPKHPHPNHPPPQYL